MVGHVKSPGNCSWPLSYTGKLVQFVMALLQCNHFNFAFWANLWSERGEMLRARAHILPKNGKQ